MENRQFPTRSYVVRPNDTLSGISMHFYGDHNKWRELARANKLSNPNFILAGQNLLIPSLSSEAPASAAPLPPMRFIPGLSGLAMEFPEISISLAAVPEVHFLLGPYSCTLRFTGTLKFRREGTVSNFTIADFEKLEFTAKSEAQGALFDLAREAKVEFNAKKLSLDLKCGLSTTLKSPYGATLTYKVEIGIGAVKFSCEPAPVKGRYRNLLIEGTYGWELTIQGEDLGRPQPAYARNPNYLPTLTTEEWGAIILIGVGLAVLTVVTFPVSAPALAALGTGGVVSYGVASQLLRSNNPPNQDGI